MRVGSAFSVRPLLTLASFALLAMSALAPVAGGQAASATSAGPALSRIDVFGGYGYFYPFHSTLNGNNYPTIPYGAVGSVAGYITPHLGIQAEGSYFPNGPADNNCAYTAQAGPIYRVPRGRFIPFAHALGGGAIVGGPRAQSCSTWGWGVTGGVGLDIVLPVFHDHLALRAFQADFNYSQINNGAVSAGGFTGGTGTIYAIRPSAGLVLRFGDVESTHLEPSFNCSTDPGNPFSGDPVTVTASAINMKPMKMTKYQWSSPVGKISGDGAVAAIDTSSVEPGTYIVTGKLVQGAKEKVVSTCTTSYTVRPYEPPTLSCAADRAAINSGNPVVITATANSPQNRQLTYTYTTSNGLISGNGPTATLTTAGTTPGAITVTCGVADDKGHTATAKTSIVVATPPPPPPQASVASLCTITFDRDRKRPDRVDNEAKGCLDDIALNLARASDNKLLVIGNHAAGETNRNAAERAMNAADYLTKEKGIDPARLDLRISADPARSVAFMLVPPGAVIDAPNATSFDTSSVKRRGQAYGTGHTAAVAPHRRKAHRAVVHKARTAAPSRHRKKRRATTAVPPA